MGSAFPNVAAVLQVLKDMTTEDGESILDSGRLTSEMTERIVTVTNLKNCIVDDVACGNIRSDLTFDPSRHRRLVRSFVDNGRPDNDVAEFLANFNPRSVYFVLHESMYVWDGAGGVLGDLLIEGEDEDDYPDTVARYLISHNKGFEASVDLLRASFTEQWPNWQTLWSWF